MSKKCNVLDWLAAILMIVGSLNWGLVGIFDFNLVTFIFSRPEIAKIVYVIVGIAGIYGIFMALKCGSSCNKK